MTEHVVIGLLGPVLDGLLDIERWENWRPSVSVCQHEDLLVKRFELLRQPKHSKLADVVAADIRSISPETEVIQRDIDWDDPWDFEDVFAALHDFTRSYSFDPDREEYLIHITTGTHVAQICLFLLTESRHLPGKLLQTSPPTRRQKTAPGAYRIIDLDLSRYDRLASRFSLEHRESLTFLKSGIETRNRQFNTMIERIEQVALRSPAPLLLMGPTGAGKSRLARQIYELKLARKLINGPFVEVNSATLRGDSAMSTLFGHTKGAFTGAVQARTGLLRKAHGGVLFLDEIGDMGLDEQAMLLRALEEKQFLPVGSDQEVRSEFQLLAGTNRELPADVRTGRFRDDLLARISLWTFRLPGLRERREDIEPNVDFELESYAARTGHRVVFNKEARSLFLKFAQSESAPWINNFRDLNGAITRMATLAPGGRIGIDLVREEFERLSLAWNPRSGDKDNIFLEKLLGPECVFELDRFDRVQLADVLTVCRTCRTLSEAGRMLFAASRRRRKKTNDADRLRKYLERFGLQWSDVANPRSDLEPIL
ncbi:MAG: RNA repair transcriptional activator RtcR [Phycisphaerales bacterium]|nr:RNA repair transcriptional activator RtcR [Phycisphaerales bacterium]